MDLIDKIFSKFFGFVDVYSQWIDSFFNKPKRKKKKKCKDCKCNCHCKEELHGHWYDGDLCVCDNCKCGA
jgi:hypothetical protein